MPQLSCEECPYRHRENIFFCFRDIVYRGAALYDRFYSFFRGRAAVGGTAGVIGGDVLENRAGEAIVDLGAADGALPGL